MIKMLLTIVTVFAVMTANASTDKKTEIEKRIKPVGQVYIAGAEPVAAVATGPRSGEQVYQSSCAACHGAGIMGAPKMGDAGAWSPRVAQGMDVLAQHAINGFNAMPAKGGCVACSDDEIKAAIVYMVDASK
ncbi:cytochrome c5 family protein [Psychrosphaera aestuarii]|nr:cytochrome c5 family protein [Psychrosphaera aestuarii]